jgi:hypothetical protein
MHPPFEALHSVTVALCLVEEFHETVKVGLKNVWHVNDLCDVQARSTMGHVWLRGKIVAIQPGPGGAICVQILRRSVQTCYPNWIHPLHLMPCGTRCVHSSMNTLWTPENEIEWAVHGF